MGLADDLARHAKLPQCTIGRLYVTLDPKDAAALREAMDSPLDQFPHAVLARILAENGHRVGNSTIGRHRNGVCGCGPS